ncbi:hypothetical protein PE066_09090 [Ramlibacter tataouinensis]|uniref:hypothetical protein n=1 Tax=Ramlibacter tataouinensis TaxID=94132 RepID=UPI0022F3BF8F|nr:hypothetical protein [Ramlibacter tataouinensis]WBY03668.1 hypothetical protein PE066_09090 [Ramlibacter tataouinensis]
MGVYEDASGKIGSFVLVAARRPNGEWAELASFRGSSPDPKAGNFSVLVKRQRRIDWCVFLPCRNTGEGNDGNTISWSRKKGFHLADMSIE